MRHPAAVVNSRSRLGWGQNLHRLFLPETIERHQAQWLHETDDPWVVAGATHGLMTSLTSRLLADYPDAMEVTYEDLCQEPMTQFNALMDFCKLPFTDDVRQHIQAKTQKDVGREISPWGTSRDSSAMRERWLRELEPDQITRIRQGFDAMHPNFYRDDQWGPLVESTVSP